MPAASVMNPPIAIKARADHDADDWRAALGIGRLSLSASGLQRSGIVPGFGAELSVAQRGTPGMGVVVGIGAALVAAPTAGHGGWNVVNTAALDLTIAAAHATLPRTDLVIARAADAQYYTGGDGAADVKVITGVAGTGAPVPAVPVAEGAYIVLAQVAVAAAASSITNANITLNTNASRAYTVAVGGVLPVANAAARTALTPYNGLVVLQLDTGGVWVWAAGAWQSLSAVSSQWPLYSDNSINTMGLSNITASNYTHVIHCRITPDKVCHLQGYFAINNTSTGLVQINGLPPIARASVELGSAMVNQGGASKLAIATAYGVAGQTASALQVHGAAPSTYYGQTGYAFASGDRIGLDLVYETTAAPN